MMLCDPVYTRQGTGMLQSALPALRFTHVFVPMRCLMAMVGCACGPLQSDRAVPPDIIVTMENVHPALSSLQPLGPKDTGDVVSVRSFASIVRRRLLPRTCQTRRLAGAHCRACCWGSSGPACTLF